MSLDSLTAKANEGNGIDALGGRTVGGKFVGAAMLTDETGAEIMGQVAPMLSDALESLPLLDFDALQMQLRQFDEIIWQQAERLAEEYRLAMLQDDEDALILIMAAA